MGPDDLQRDRDRRLRRVVLRALLFAKSSPMGGLSGDALGQHVNSAGSDSGDVFDDDAHALRLIRSLAAKQMVRETFLPRRHSERFGLKNLMFRLADKGERLLNETEPPDPDIVDDRMILNPEP